MTNMSRLARMVLDELAKDENLSDQSLSILMEHLENKPDPDSSEILLVDSIYQFLEKKRIFETHLRKFIKEQRDKSNPNKLEMIYESQDKTRDWDL